MNNQPQTFRVTVFGGSQPGPGSEAYQQAYHLGAQLGSQGWTVLTGGYIGTMEAVSKGASENGGHVIGVTCDEIEDWRPVGPNPWVEEELRFPTLRQRLYALIDECDAALALPGGIGTLAEIGAAWAHNQTQAGAKRPLILIGPGWQNTFATFIDELGEYVQPEDQRLIQFVPDPEAATARLGEVLGS